MLKKAEVDISNQIDNSWTKDSALAIVQDGLKYSVLIDVQKKGEIKKFIEKEFEKKKKKKRKAKENKQEEKRKKKFKNRVVSITHAYLLYKILKDNENSLKKVKVCKDTIPEYLDKYLQRIKYKKGDSDKLKHIKVKFGLKKNNKAQEYAKEVAKKNILPSYTLNRRDVEEIINCAKSFTTL